MYLDAVGCGNFVGFDRCGYQQCSNSWHASQSFKLLLQRCQPSFLCNASNEFLDFFFLYSIL